MSIPRRIPIRVVLENMALRSPSGFFEATRAAQQESNEAAVQDAMLYRVAFDRDVWRWAGSGRRIASWTLVEEDVWGRKVASRLAIALAMGVVRAQGQIFERFFLPL